jgi:hypothetical protein
MPTTPTPPPADRFFARIERFQCACPSCGRLLNSTQDQGHLARHFKHSKEARTTDKYRKRARTVTAASQLTWNPYTQRLRCPWCRYQFVVGLLVFPVGDGLKGSGAFDPPPDVAPTRSERLELRRLAGGYCAEESYAYGAPVNHYVPAPCSCPEKGWIVSCPVHGQMPSPV